jgi:hypothetical protein
LPGTATLPDRIPGASYSNQGEQLNDAAPPEGDSFLKRLVTPFWEQEMSFNTPFGVMDMPWTPRGRAGMDRMWQQSGPLGEAFALPGSPAAQESLERDPLYRTLTGMGPAQETPEAQAEMAADQAAGESPTLTPEQVEALEDQAEQRREMAQRVAAYRQRLMGMPEEVENQLATLGQNEAVIARMQDQSALSEAEIAKLQDQQSAMVDEFAESLEQQSAVEKALASLARSPADLARERRNRAMAQLGAVIGGATVVGDVARGLGGINESIYEMEQDQRDEQRDIQMALAGAQDARERERRSILIQQGGTEVAQAIGKMDRAQRLMETAIRSRTLNANSAAQLLNTLQTSIAATLRAAEGTGALDRDTLLKTIDTYRQLREEFRTGRMEGLDPSEQAATTDIIYRLDNLIQQALEDLRMPWQNTGLAGAAGDLGAAVAEAVAGMEGN